MNNLGTILIFLQPNIWSSSNHFKTIHSPVFFHIRHSPDFHQKYMEDSKPPPSPPPFLFIAVQLNPAHLSKLKPSLFEVFVFSLVLTYCDILF